MSEIKQAAAARPPLRHRWPKGIFGLLAYFYDHCMCRYEYPVNWNDVRMLDDSMTGFMVCANGGISVFDGIEVEILRRLLRGEEDPAIVEGLGVRPYAIANVRAKLRRDLGMTTAAQLAQLAAEYGAALDRC